MYTTSSFTVVASFTTLAEAEICKGMLLSHGIAATLLDAETVTMNWAYSQAVGGVKVAVPSVVAQQAQGYIAATMEPEVTTVMCARCGSTTIETTLPGFFRLLWMQLIGGGTRRMNNEGMLRCAVCKHWL